MKLGVLKAKVKRNGLVEFAGRYYVDETSIIVKKLNGKGEKALLGIQTRKGTYTVIGEEYIHYRTASAIEGKVSLKAFIEELECNGDRIGLGYFKVRFMYKNIILSNGDKVGLRNCNTMFGLWNTIIWLEKLTH